MLRDLWMVRNQRRNMFSLLSLSRFFEPIAPTPFFRVGCDASSTEQVCLRARFLVEKRSKTPLPPQEVGLCGLPVFLGAMNGL